MSLRNIRAAIECDGCGKQFHVDLDPARFVQEWLLIDYAEDAVRSGDESPDGGCTSVQHDLELCGSCTKIADAIGDEHYNPTREEILEAVGAR